MSALKDQINSELKQAMLNKDVFVRDTLRLVTSEIKRFEVKKPEVEISTFFGVVWKELERRTLLQIALSLCLCATFGKVIF